MKAWPWAEYVIYVLILSACVMFIIAVYIAPQP